MRRHLELAKYCFAASYAVAFLHEGLGVSLHDTRWVPADYCTVLYMLCVLSTVLSLASYTVTSLREELELEVSLHGTRQALSYLLLLQFHIFSFGETHCISYSTFNSMCEAEARTAIRTLRIPTRLRHYVCVTKLRGQIDVPTSQVSIISEDTRESKQYCIMYKTFPSPFRCPSCRLRFTNFVKGQSVDWAQGALILDLLNSSHLAPYAREGPLLSSATQSQGGGFTYSDVPVGSTLVDRGRTGGMGGGAGWGGGANGLFAWRVHVWVPTLALALCCFVGLGLRSFKRRLKPAGTTIYDLEKGRYITSAPRTSMSRSR